MTQLQLKNIPGARKAPLPDFITPQLATLVKEAPVGDEWLHELKFDGYRMLCHLNKGKAQFWSRNKNDWTGKFPRLARELHTFPATTAVLDGEIVIMDAAGRTSFQKLQQSIGKSSETSFNFVIFDLLYLDGYKLTGVRLSERKRLLEQLFKLVPTKSPLRYSDHVQGNGPEFFRHACQFGVEGIMSKRADSLYESLRNRNWLKVKCGMEQEFVIAGYTPSEKGLPGFGSLVLGVYEKDKLVYAGRVGTGFSFKKRLELRKILDRMVVKTMPLAQKPKDPGLRQAVWTQPKLVAEVAFTEWTSDGSIRHPSFKGLREDKSAKEVVREEPQKTR
ncbi:MAG TPA: non-homologous end-joining DNA ligase [Pyrinomonadaceae bacterium]|nr:non-homologous end-joining DNA ligase [Pyrinomonadaceae bacterium]